MNKLFIVANLKSNKNEIEAKNWLEEFKKIKELGQALDEKEMIICPSFTLLSLFTRFFKENNLLIKLGAQNVSPFSEGAYTGEVNAKQIKEFADYVIIGHSERRSNFKESDDMLLDKAKMSLEHGLSPIYCVQDKDALVPKGVSVVAYEPVFAIGSGNSDTPENADNVANFIKTKGNYQVLYGGSVTPQNVKSFTDKENLSGVLVGGASLNPNEFIQIIQNA